MKKKKRERLLLISWDMAGNQPACQRCKVQWQALQDLFPIKFLSKEKAQIKLIWQNLEKHWICGLGVDDHHTILFWAIHAKLYNMKKVTLLWCFPLCLTISRVLSSWTLQQPGKPSFPLSLLCLSCIPSDWSGSRISWHPSSSTEYLSFLWPGAQQGPSLFFSGEWKQTYCYFYYFIFQV